MKASSGPLLAIASICLCLPLAVPASAQNINITTPLQTFGESGFENWGGGRLNMNGRRNDGSGFSLGFNMAKGSNRTSITNAPSLTVQNGFGGSIFSGQIRPFVTGFVPVVGQQRFAPMPVDNAVTRAIHSGQLELNSPTLTPDTLLNSASRQSFPDAPSSATRGDSSVAEIKAQRAAAAESRKRMLEEQLADARKLVDQDERSLARSSFRAALKLTDDPSEKRRIKLEIEATRN